MRVSGANTDGSSNSFASKSVDASESDGSVMRTVFAEPTKGYCGHSVDISTFSDGSPSVTPEERFRFPSLN